MDQSIECQSNRGVPGWILLSAALPFVYVLSIGPVGAITKSGSGTTLGNVRTFYAPVIWLHDRTPLKRPLEIYAALWGWH
jgi:hypothetical protein